MKIGYARVSKEEQNIDLQTDALKTAGCEKIFIDQGISAVAKKRPEFEKAVLELQKGDQFIIWKFDRAFRSTAHAAAFLEELEKREVKFQSLTENIDTATPMGRAIFQISAVFAELERSLISERTKAGIAASRSRGQKMGRPPALTPMQIEWVKEMREKGESMSSIARTLGVHRSTLYEHLAKDE